MSDRKTNALDRFAKENGIAPLPSLAPLPLPPPEARLLGELVLPSEDDPNELLKHRFLCRGGGLLLVGPTGIGKSALVIQFMISWALARDAFGLKPPRPLKSLLVQAENDDGDLAEMRDGVMRGLVLTPEQRDRAGKLVLVVREDERTGFAFVQGLLRPLLEKHRPDVLWIDPALAYLGGEASSQKDVGAFLRNLLNPLLREFNCGCVIVHHTNKPAAGREKADWQAGDFAYLGSGSIEWAGWARCVVALRSVGSHSVFELRSCKRGSRLGWKEADGSSPAYAKLIAHSKEAGRIFWREPGPDEAPEQRSSKRLPLKADVLAHVPIDKPIAKAALRSKANAAGIALNRINGLIAELVAEGSLHEWRVPRPRTNALRMLSRLPPSPEQLIAEASANGKSDPDSHRDSNGQKTCACQSCPSAPAQTHTPLS
ncbi:MAG: AAA family ATPase [Verrucomicrobiota bacterium]